jgi:hypothetical protein
VAIDGFALCKTQLLYGGTGFGVACVCEKVSWEDFERGQVRGRCE